MKTLILAAACLLWCKAAFAQTAPTSSASSSASGTKNVGTDRADAPQAPGMTSNGARSAVTPPRRSASKAHAKPMSKSTTQQTSQQ